MGNPLSSEVAAFRWLIAVLIAAASVILIAKLIGSGAAVVWALVLLAVVSVFIVKGIAHMLGSPDDDEVDGPDTSD